MDMRMIGSQAIYKRRNTSGTKDNVRKNHYKDKATERTRRVTS